MDIENLTIGQVRELKALLGGDCQPAQTNPCIGKYCIFRGQRHGVYAGKFVGVAMMGNIAFAEVHDARRLQYQKYNGYTLSSVATMGLHADSNLSPPVPVHMLQLADDAEVFPVDAASEKSIREMPNGE